MTCNQARISDVSIRAVSGQISADLTHVLRKQKAAARRENEAKYYDVSGRTCLCAVRTNWPVSGFILSANAPVSTWQCRDACTEMDGAGKEKGGDGGDRK